MFVSHQPNTTRRLTPEHEKTVKATLPVIGAHINEITPVFYNKMFTAHPELIADTFNRGNQKQGDQQKALAASIAVFATMLVDPDAPDPKEMLSRIGHKHVSLGITRDQYQIVHDNLFAAIVEVLGEAVTPEVAEAWDEVYWIMADVLIEFEQDLYDSDGVTAGDVFRKVKVTGKEDISDGVIELTVTGDLKAPQPGQYTSLGVKLPDGARQLRQYSLISGTDTEYRVAIEVTGEVSTFIRDNVHVGDEIDATLPAGELVLDDSPRPVVLISQGIGSTPMVGMLSALAEEGSSRPVTVWHADASESAHAQREEMTTLVGKLPHASMETFYRDQDQRLALSSGCGRGCSGKQDALAGADVYLCGGTGFLQNIREQIAALPAEKAPATLRFELFSPNDWLIG